ncbi:MAG: translocation/assembly module TamB, partial [Bacteroidetes bacterium]|nr:translocation/assembly module TamB [Bacteroidota bacterium]
MVAKKVTTRLNNDFGTDINIERLGLNWKGEVDIRGTLIRDHHLDTLIYAEEIQTSILSVKRLTEGDLDFGFIELTNAILNIKTYKGEKDDNLLVFTDKFETGEPPSGNPFLMVSEDVYLYNTQVVLTDENLDTPEIINFEHVYLDATNFSVTGPNVAGQVNSLTLDAARGFSVQKLQADFSYTPEALTFEDLALETEYSFINGLVVLRYGEEGLSDFNNKVIIDANLENTAVSTNDLNGFYNEFGPNINIDIEGMVYGTLNDFTFKNGQLSYGNSRLTGAYSFKNLLNDAPYVISGRNHRISTNYYDLRRILPNLLGNELPDELKSFGEFRLTGNSTLEDDFLTTDSVLISDLGTADVDLELGNIHNFDNAFYSGNVLLSNFDLSKLTNSNSFGLVDADVSIDGRGFTSKTVNTKIHGNVGTFNFEGYTYRDIDVSGNLKDPIFNGRLRIDDPNLKLEFNGLVDISKKFNQYDFEANIEYAELNKLNLFKRDSISIFTGRVIMDMQGTNVNDAEGNIEFI